MILLTRLNNRPLVVNSDMIKFIENTPDTVLTLVSGEKIVVLESVAEVMEAIMSFRARVVAAAGPLVQSPDRQEKKRDEREK
jgi:flagellar protein FlbD